MMVCIDPAGRDRLADAPSDAVGPWSAHLARCEGCRDAAAALALAPGEVHPSGDAMAAYAADPRLLPPRAAAFVGAHLEACATCRSLLETVPEEAPIALERRSIAPRTIFAAAGWIVAAFIFFRTADRAPSDAPLVEEVQTIVLSATRGESGAAVDRSASVLRLRLVTGEDVALGATLRLAFIDAADRELLNQAVDVREKDERDWPVLTLDPKRVPERIVRLEVTLPSGKTIAYPLVR